MIYIKFLVILFIFATVLYYVAVKKEKKSDNLMNDFPIVNISSEDLERHALQISSEYSKVKNTTYRRKLMRSLTNSYNDMLKNYEYIDRDVTVNNQTIPAAEWLLDNLYLIEKEYKGIKHSMPEAYYNALPVIGSGLMKGYPRIYHIAIELISHTDGRIDENSIKTFLHSYQKNAVLTSGELWALPIMLRIGLIEKISSITDSIITSLIEKKRGEVIAEKLINALQEGKVEDELKKLSEQNIKFSSHLVERLFKILRDNGVDNKSVYNFLEEQMELMETSIEKMITLEHQKQASFQLSMGNCVTGIREVEALNWRSCFEELSYVENVLNEDPSKIYENMDFDSKDNYRHKIEILSRKLKKSESFIAKKAIECAKENAELEEYKRHVGYYIVDDGINCLKQKIGYKEKGFERLNEYIKSNKVSFYIGTLILGTIALMSLTLYASYKNDFQFKTWKYIIAAIAILVPCSEIIISICNWSITSLVKPKFIPKNDFIDGIPEEFSTIVVIPTIIGNVDKVHDLVNNMEVYYLANGEKNIYFALLGDFKDSDREVEELDEKIREAALSDIKALNEKYSKDGKDIFYFLSRYRKYNEKEGKWIAWERKRGKLAEFNKLIRGNKNTTYDTVSGDISLLSNIKYVITLDADTQLPRDSAKKLIGAISHPLNRAYSDKNKKKIIRGYGLLQPRISISTVSANKTIFSKIFSGETGIDTYTTAVSDVYQDMFGEGIFTGKGIYDIDIFNYMFDNEIPENTVLSHDLLEGSYVRAGLVTDIELIDGYPAYYNASCKRLHRWVRGDWQLIPWLFKKSPINRLSKWKILDNIRRSLLAPSIIILILFALTILPDGTDKWLTIALLAVLCPLLFDVSEAVVSPIKGISLSGRISRGKDIIEQIFLIFSFLPYQCYLMLDAILRTIYRMTISKKSLLEWQTAADAEASSGKKLEDYIKSMWIGSLLAVLIGVLAFYNRKSYGIILTIPVIIWFIAPYIAYYISKERKKTEVQLTEEQEDLLRRIARKTWAYFYDFVDDENNWLAPDNYQELPDNGVAHRTSPTNMAMGLTSNLVAYDFGYVGIIETVSRIDKIINSMESLERDNGHFYNWYNTLSKEPLYPKYVSTVDSGNLVGYFWITMEALEEYKSEAVIKNNKLRGLLDTVILAKDEFKNKLGKEAYAGEIQEIEEMQNYEFNIILWKRTLMNIWNECNCIDEEHKNIYWNSVLKNMVSSYIMEVQKFFPWVDIIVEKNNKFEDTIKKMKSICSTISLNDLYDEYINLINELQNRQGEVKTKDDISWHKELIHALNSGKNEIYDIKMKIKDLIDRINNLAEATDFSMVYDKDRKLFYVGYNVDKDSTGKSYYDLLASESRQASFIAIAKGDVDQEHWFKLGRAMTFMGKTKGLVSWSGTMFEYFMPLLIMKNYPDTLWDETYKSVIEGQKKYCKEKRVPWGISESAYYSFDPSLNYQYKAFGVPGIGLKRGLINELVISPYSSVLALQTDVQGSYHNLLKLISEGLEGRYGFYEAIDYTKDRMLKGKKKSIIKCFMVHHEGMSLMALDNVLNDRILQKRFHRVPMVKATELLLQEKVPKKVTYDRDQKFDMVDTSLEKQSISVRRFETVKTLMPECHLLSNGSYSLMITNSGSGYSKKDDLMLYRWKEDVTLDNTGMFFFIKDVSTNEYWSATYSPCGSEGKEYEAIFSLDKAEFNRKDGEEGKIDTQTQIVVSNEDDAEIRKITITNHGNQTKIFDITSYLEVILTKYNADIVHPAFSNLFIETEYSDEGNCIIATRRIRSEGETQNYMMETMMVEGETIGSIQYETSRINFIGRCRNISKPLAMESNTPLQNTVGAVLDPILSMRRRIKVEPGGKCNISFIIGIGTTKEEVVELSKKYNQIQNIKRVFELAWTQAQVEMKYMGIKSRQANLYQHMVSRIVFLNNLLPERTKYIQDISKGQSALWPYGISGDLPIILLIVRQDDNVEMVRQILTAHEYWSGKGLKVDLVIVNMQQTSYMQPLQEAITDLINSSYARDKQNKTGGVFLYNLASIPIDDIRFLIGISKIVIDSERGSLWEQIKREGYRIKYNDVIKISNINYSSKPYKYELPKLQFYNEFGGFSEDGSKYIIRLKENINTPAPWINVISNGKFGFHVSESGISYTWNKNSREHKITPWSNDWITDEGGETLYLRDEDTGKLWGLTSKPIRDKEDYIIEHGFGYSSFKHYANGIYGEMIVYVPMSDSIKIAIVTLKNESNINRKLSITYYAHTVLGVVPQNTAQYISTYKNENEKFIYAINPYSDVFKNLISYLKIYGGSQESYTGNRTEFIGRNESIEYPISLIREKLSNTTGSGMDPCLAYMSKIDLMPNETKKLVVLLGEDESIEEVIKNVKKYSSIEKAEEELENSKRYWDKLLHSIVVKTPDKTMDIMLNGWLLYQTLSCRIWARTAFYQSGGAYGFRDQLQDVMSFAYINPKITRDQIVYSASKQFLEGDVQHWWHPVVESGIRTRFSDDLLWLPFVTIDYIKNTGDYSILDEEVSYLEDEPLKDGEDERYKISRKSNEKGTIYEHCIKAIQRSLKFGDHNIPLMGSGDWNDGMSTVGNKGKGESVWLGWFLYKILDEFKDICKLKDDNDNYEEYIKFKKFIKENMDKNAWDGKWYRRAYFDNGEPLGSIENDECQIDSLAQSWSIISNGGEPEKCDVAMQSLENYLIKKDKGLVLLLTPPFNTSLLEPGYIKGYVPGIRENGGQYTHSVTWVILAFTKINDGDKAWSIYNMINPINHTKSYYECERYKVEPYVMAADVYAVEPYTGRGGWSWYTGTSGWMYRVGIDNILGLKLKGENGFAIEPCVPKDWDEYQITYTRGKCIYNIKVIKGIEKSLKVDGKESKDNIIPYFSDGSHDILVTI